MEVEARGARTQGHFQFPPPIKKKKKRSKLDGASCKRYLMPNLMIKPLKPTGGENNILKLSSDTLTHPYINVKYFFKITVLGWRDTEICN